MKKKLIALSTFVLSLGLLAGIAVAGDLVGGRYNPAMSANGDPVTLTLNKDLNDKMGLPKEADASYTPINYTLDSNNYGHLELVNVSKHNDFFVRLNKGANSSSAPSYFRKKEECKGMTSISIRLAGGSVEVLTGYIKASNDLDVDDVIYTNKYVVKYKDSTTFTFPVEGNYFKVQNVSCYIDEDNKGANALVHSFSVTYGCEKNKTADVPSYTVTKGYNSTVHNNRGKWYFYPDGTTSIGTTTFAHNRIDSFINSVDGSKFAYYRYEAVKNSVFTDTAIISFTLCFDKDVKVQRGANTCDFVANVEQSFDASRTISDNPSDSTDIFYVKSAVTDLTVTVTNILISRTVQ